MNDKKFFKITVLLVLLLSLTACSAPEELPREEIGNVAATAASAILDEMIDAAQDLSEAVSEAAEKEQSAPATTGLLTSSADLDLTPSDDKGMYYTFTYGGEEFTARYTRDHWKIMNSYKISSEADMLIICQALIDLHPVHGKDMSSYRTADDMVYEWVVHNLGYMMVSDEDASMKEHLRDVDFDPEDQGCSFDELYYNHTVKEFDLKDILGG